MGIEIRRNKLEKNLLACNKLYNWYKVTLFSIQIYYVHCFLLKCNIVNSSLCDFCNMHEETIIHLFWECQISRDFWNSVEMFLNNKGLNITVNYETISLGMYSLNKDNNIVSFVLILAKYFIFCSKYKKIIPNNLFNIYIRDKI